jgi:hypothetical protein
VNLYHVDLLAISSTFALEATEATSLVRAIRRLHDDDLPF